MISSAELRRLAGAWNADSTVVERDYVLSWVLEYDQVIAEVERVLTDFLHTLKS